jgi:hypothetical protein
VRARRFVTTVLVATARVVAMAVMLAHRAIMADLPVAIGLPGERQQVEPTIHEPAAEASSLGQVYTGEHNHHVRPSGEVLAAKAWGATGQVLIRGHRLSR